MRTVRSRVEHPGGRAKTLSRHFLATPTGDGIEDSADLPTGDPEGRDEVGKDRDESPPAQFFRLQQRLCGRLSRPSGYGWARKTASGRSRRRKRSPEQGHFPASMNTSRRVAPLPHRWRRQGIDRGVGAIWQDELPDCGQSMSSDDCD
jgi:hypothetical protein